MFDQFFIHHLKNRKFIILTIPNILDTAQKFKILTIPNLLGPKKLYITIVSPKK
ncbi:hypothetical protein MUK42_32443 [Musa troglodytarum]|uniref:Uncharacterized protein n=1 Tax=Musa troglodytarum TaxID=320322 RepID=A0A9E7IDC7_9LILI|nr:hypothetical protein MUK42_32443 [Musa troglodytarum]